MSSVSTDADQSSYLPFPTEQHLLTRLKRSAPSRLHAADIYAVLTTEIPLIIRGVRSLEETTRHLVGGFNFSRVIIPEKRAYRQTHLAAISLICRHYAIVDIRRPFGLISNGVES